MWRKPWAIKEGFAVGLAFCVMGLLLQWGFGPIRWSLVAWPTNIIILSVYLVLIILTYALRKKNRFLQWCMGYQAAVPALALASVLAVALGLMTDLSLLRHWTFVLIFAWVTTILGWISIKRILHFRSWKRDIPFLLNHIGLFIALTTATLGNADIQRLHMTVFQGQMEWRGIDENRQFHELPFSLRLNQFILEEYPPHPVGVDEKTGQMRYERVPKRFASDVTLFTSDGAQQDATIEVNHPLAVGGWNIYQLGYDEESGKESEYSILELVSDPWLPFVYTGIYMLIAGAVWMFLTAGKKKEESV